MKMNRILTALVGAGLLSLMSSPVMARNTTGPFDNAVKQAPAMVLAQEDPQEQRHEEQRYQEQMRQDQKQSDQQTAMRHHAHHSTRKHYKQHVHSSEVDQNNGHDAH